MICACLPPPGPPSQATHTHCALQVQFLWPGCSSSPVRFTANAKNPSTQHLP